MNVYEWLVVVLCVVVASMVGGVVYKQHKQEKACKRMGGAFIEGQCLNIQAVDMRSKKKVLTRELTAMDTCKIACLAMSLPDCKNESTDIPYFTKIVINCNKICARRIGE